MFAIQSLFDEYKLLKYKECALGIRHVLLFLFAGKRATVLSSDDADTIHL